MAVISAADRVHRARSLHQDSIDFAIEFWNESELLPYLTLFIERISDTETGVSNGGLELGLALRRMVAEKCLARWGVDGEARFRTLSEDMYRLHAALHATNGTVTAEVRTMASLILQEIEVTCVGDSP